MVEHQDEGVKFIKDGLTYSTEDSKALAVLRGVRHPREGDPDFPAVEIRFQVTLRRTPKAALFLHTHRTTKFAKGKPVVQDECDLMSPADAAHWLAATGAAILDAEDLPLPPAA